MYVYIYMYNIRMYVYVYMHMHMYMYMYVYVYVYIYIYTVHIYGPESKLCMKRSAVFRTYGTKGLRNWSCSGPLECDEI